ncbi:beta strand repeat-containing protein [uncultured Roseovarius sp.]|uniref:beta strand repeat-containing protein n=1 Tax=Roseovarius sp. TaxID=1486281 RepID=UPI0025E3B95B|nr:hypothetical protein [uncultured Roseovarius sp.]
MPIDPITTDLIHDQSEGTTDSDINYNDGTTTDLESISNDFYTLLVNAGLITDAVNATTTYGDRVAVGASADDWITVNETGTVAELRFAADGSGTALDGDVWTDGGSNVLTADTNEIIYLYAVGDGQVLVGSTTAPTDPSWGGTLPDELNDFSSESIVIVGYLDAAADLKTAEVYYGSFRAVTNPDPTLHDADYVDLADNVWVYGDTRQVLTFSGLDPKKFLFGLAGEDAPDSSPTVKIFVLGENYNVQSNADEDFEKGNTSGALLNTSSAGVFNLTPSLDIATVGVNNQSTGPGDGIFVAFTLTDQPVGNYYKGTDADNLDAIQSQTEMGFGIVQAVGDTSGIEVELSGYFGNYTDGADLIEDNGAAQGDPDQTLGDPADVVPISSVKITWPVGAELPDGTYASLEATFDATTAHQTYNLNGRMIVVDFVDDFGSGPTKVILNGVDSQDLITLDWAGDVDHALLHTNDGAIDWGVVTTQVGGEVSANVGADMLHDDDGPTASVSAGTEPGTVYLFDGNTTTDGNWEGNNGTGYPTDDAIANQDPTTATLDFSGAFTTNHQYGTDGGTGLATTYSLVLTPVIGSAVMMGGSQATSGGTNLVWAVSAGGGYAAVLDGTATEIFEITISGSVVTFEQKGVIDQPVADNDPVTQDILLLDNGQLAVQRSDTITDNDSDTDSDAASVDLGGNFGIGDDEPVVTVSQDVGEGEIAALGVNLDETIDPDNDQLADGADNFAAGEAESISATDPGPYGPGTGNGDLDDVIVDGTANTAVWKTNPGGYNNVGDEGIDQAIGRLESTAGQISALFGSVGSSIRYGADGPDGAYENGGFDHALAFDLSGSGPIETSLIATAVVDSPLDGVSEANRTVHLFEVADGDGDITVIEGRVKGADGAWGGGDDFVIVRMSLTNKDDPANATIVYENFAPVQNPNTNLQDDTVGVYIPAIVGESLSIVYSVDARDKDLDTDAGSASVVLIDDDTTILEIDDDGPGSLASPDTVDLWEDGLPDGLTDNDGEAEVTTESGDLSTQVIAGTDGVKNFGWTTDASFLTGLNALGHSSGGDPLVWTIDHDVPALMDADVLYGKTTIGDETIVEVIVSEDGTYDMTVYGPLDNLVIGEEATIIIDYTDGLVAYEGDNDPVAFQPNALRMRLENDAPYAEVNADGTEPDVQYLFDGNATTVGGNGNFEGDNGFGLPLGDAPADGVTDSVTVNFSGAFSDANLYGADGPGSTVTDFTLVPDTGLDGSAVMMSGVAVASNGTGVVWDVVDDYTINATAGVGGTVVFSLTSDGLGGVTFSQNAVLDHLRADTSAPYTTDILTLDDGQVALRRTDTVTDYDTDQDSAYDDIDLGGNFGIGDDAAVANVNAGGTEPDAVYLFDGNTSGSGNFEGDNGFGLPTGDATADGPNTVVVNFAPAFGDTNRYGGDGPGSTVSVHSLQLLVTAGSAVMMSGSQAESGGVGLVWAIDGVTGDYLAVTDNLEEDEILRFSVSAAGLVTFTQSGVLDHPVIAAAAPYTTDILTLDDSQLAIRRTDTVTDYDGDQDVDYAEVDLGGNFGAGDDGPVISPTDGGILSDIPTIDFIAGETETVDEEIAYGADGAGDFIITSVGAVSVPMGSVLGTITSEISIDGHSVTYFSSGIDAQTPEIPDDGAFFEVQLDPSNGDYTGTILASPPLIKLPLFSGGTLPGGPVEEYTPVPPGDIVTFDGFISADWDGDGTMGTLTLKQQFDSGGDNNGPVNSAESNEDINIDTNGIGLENAIMNENEALSMWFSQDVAGVEIVFEGSTGGLSTFSIQVEAYDDGVFVDSDIISGLTAPNGPNSLAVEFIADDEFDELYLSLSLTGNDAIRIPEISAFTFAEIDDLTGTVNVELSDFEGDTDAGSFDWFIEGDPMAA